MTPVRALWLCVGLVFGMAPASGQEILIFAAASLTNALNEVAAHFNQSRGVVVTVSYASSSILARQIEQGAPATLFISASPEWMDYLERRRLLSAGSRFDLVGNQLVLVAPKGHPVAFDVTPDCPLADWLGSRRLATGDHDHVPLGGYARAALETLGIWSAVEPKIARADNARAALALVSRGETPLGIVYYSDAVIDGKIQVVSPFPATSHPPIIYPAAMIAGKEHPAAVGFLDFLRSPTAAAVFRRHGFTPNR